MTILDCHNILKDEEELLKGSFYGFRGLGKKGHLAAHFGRALTCAVQAQVAFIFAMLALVANWPRPVSVLAGLAAIVVVAALFITVAVILLSIWSGRLYKRRYRRGILYWSWWPCVDFLLAAGGALAGALLGHYYWYSGLDTYYQMQRLQPYTGINPALVPGEQLIDAGAVSFSEDVDVDRSRGGCFVHSGHTFCVAPIVYTGQLMAGMGNAPQFGSWDYFAVGVDCCNCPNQDFRCGDWRNPLAQGGIRSLDYRSRPFFKLAVEDWTSMYHKASLHPLFFDWVQQPETLLFLKWRWATHASFLCAVTFFPTVFLLAVLAGQVLVTLVRHLVATPHDTPPPPLGLEKAWDMFLPEAVEYLRKEREQLLSLPISPTPWYGPGPPPAGYGTATLPGAAAA